MIQEVEKVSVEETTESEITKATLMDHLRERNVSSTPVKTKNIQLISGIKLHLRHPREVLKLLYATRS